MGINGQLRVRLWNQIGLIGQIMDFMGKSDLLGKAYPPPPLAIGIIGLGGNSGQIFDFKGVTAKVFENQ